MTQRLTKEREQEIERTILDLNTTQLPGWYLGAILDLKDELTALRDENEKLRAERDEAQGQARKWRDAENDLCGAYAILKKDWKDAVKERDEILEVLRKIADPRKRDHNEPDAYTQLGCIMNMANDLLEKIGKS